MQDFWQNTVQYVHTTTRYYSTSLAYSRQVLNIGVLYRPSINSIGSSMAENGRPYMPIVWGIHLLVEKIKIKSNPVSSEWLLFFCWISDKQTNQRTKEQTWFEWFDL